MNDEVWAHLQKIAANKNAFAAAYNAEQERKRAEAAESPEAKPPEGETTPS